jgi:hypothetical protein
VFKITASAGRINEGEALQKHLSSGNHLTARSNGINKQNREYI